MTTTLADLERNNWELLRTKIKNGITITIKIPINIEKYNFTGYRYNYVFTPFRIQNAQSWPTVLTQPRPQSGRIE